MDIENDGRENATISSIELIVPQTGEELEMFNRNTQRGWQSENIGFSGNDRKTVHLRTSGQVLEEYNNTISGTIKMDSTTGEVTKDIVFEIQD
jgi:hypothetical protein